MREVDKERKKRVILEKKTRKKKAYIIYMAKYLNTIISYNIKKRLNIIIFHMVREETLRKKLYQRWQY